MLFPFWIDMAVPMFMIISGYVSAASFERQNYNGIGEAYSFNAWFSKAIRFIIPFTTAFLIEFIMEVFILKRFSILQIGLRYFSGGFGPGSYYFPVMIQFVFVFPCIYFILKRYNLFGLSIIFLINASYEFFQCIYGMSEQLYRLLLLRYLFVIAFGVYVYMLKEKSIRKIWGVIALIIGIAFIGLVEYNSYNPKIIIYWTGTSFMACLYIMLIAYILLSCKKRISFKPLEVLGKASFNVFLTQMVYYTYMAGAIYKYISSMCLRILINILICGLFGVIFYHIENPLTKRLLIKIKNKNFEINLDKFNKLLLKSV